MRRVAVPLVMLEFCVTVATVPVFCHKYSVVCVQLRRLAL